jgi:hypothetical protein
MDPSVVSILASNITPVLATLFTFGMPVAIVWIVKHFKLKNRELELEAQIHSKDLELRLRTLEARQAAVEAALGALGGRPPNSLQERMSMLEPPAPAAAPGESVADPQPVRSG